jgi:hypothetical protein
MVKVQQGVYSVTVRNVEGDVAVRGNKKECISCGRLFGNSNACCFTLCAERSLQFPRAGL